MADGAASGRWVPLVKPEAWLGAYLGDSAWSWV